jgi:predicted DNA-binding ribbon-helix-helix protein
MSKEVKNISVEVSNECWKCLKMISISREISLQQLVREILEKSAAKKKTDLEVSV